jgi:hypothetical protein
MTLTVQRPSQVSGGTRETAGVLGADVAAEEAEIHRTPLLARSCLGSTWNKTRFVPYPSERTLYALLVPSGEESAEPCGSRPEL